MGSSGRKKTPATRADKPRETTGPKPSGSAAWLVDECIRQREVAAMASALPVVLGCVALAVAQAAFGSAPGGCECSAVPNVTLPPPVPPVPPTPEQLHERMAAELHERCELYASELWEAAGVQTDAIAWRRLTLCQQHIATPSDGTELTRAERYVAMNNANEPNEANEANGATDEAEACMRAYHADMRRQRATFDALMWHRYVAMHECAVHYVGKNPGRATTMFDAQEL